MIITRTPFRISFIGGSTDFPDFYLKYGGAVVSGKRLVAPVLPPHNII